MKKIVAILFIVSTLMAQSVFAQRYFKGNGNIVKVERRLSPFTGIIANSADDIIITTKGTPNTVIIETDENLQQKVSIQQKNNFIDFSYAKIKPKHLKFYVNVPNLDILKISGAADVKSIDTIKVNKLKIIASGAGDIKLNVISKKIQLNVSGAADVNLSGKTEHLFIKGSGAADVKTGKLVADSVYAIASGAATLFVYPVKYLNKKKSGAARIKITNNSEKIINIESSDKPEKFIIYKGNDNISNYSDTTNVKIGSINLEVVDGDTTKIRLGNHILVVDDDGDVRWDRCKPHNFNGHWGGVELGINGYVTPEFNTYYGKKYDFLSLRYEKSIALNLNLFEQNFSLNKAKTIGLITGIGFSFNNYRFVQPVYLSPDSTSLSGFYMNDVNVKKSKLTVAYITVPLFFELQTDNARLGKRFHFALGAILNARIGSHTKIYFNEANKQYRFQIPATGEFVDGYFTTPNRTNRNIVKSFNSFGLQPFRVDASARIGYGPINIFATYAITSMFQKNRGPELYNWTVGITIVGW